MAKYVLAIDQGTTGSTVSLVSDKGKVVCFVNKEFKQIYPKPGWVEHSPNDIWASVLFCIKAALKKSKVRVTDIAAIGITNQRETCLVWDKATGESLYNAIVWQCRRTTDVCARLKKNKLEPLVKRKTGLVLDPYFSATKISWILRKCARKSKIKNYIAGNIDTYLIWRLTQGQSHVTDVSNASRTSLMNLKTLCWDNELLKLFQVPKSVLPEIKASNDLFGFTKGVAGLPDGIPIHGVAGDQQSALFGQTAFKAGEAKCTFGTGSFILMNTGKSTVFSRKGLLTTVAWKLKNDKTATYALEGGAFVCGAAVQWLRDGLGLIKKSEDIEALAAQVKSSEGVEFVPALTGLGAPYWQPEARGVISGLTRGSHSSHIAFATLEAMALQNVEILKAMESDLGRKLKNLRVDGGASKNKMLMQLQANYLGKSIIKPKTIETTVSGAAYLAGLGVGLWSSKKELEKLNEAERVFSSQITPKQRNQRLLRWQKAVKLSF